MYWQTVCRFIKRIWLFKGCVHIVLDTVMDYKTGVSHYSEGKLGLALLTVACPIVAYITSVIKILKMKDSEQPNNCVPNGCHEKVWRVCRFIPFLQPAAYPYLMAYFENKIKNHHRIPDYAKLITIADDLKSISGMYEATPEAVLQLYAQFTDYNSTDHTFAYYVNWIKIASSLVTMTNVFLKRRLKKLPFMIVENEDLDDLYVQHQTWTEKGIAKLLYAAHYAPYFVEFYALIGLRVLGFCWFTHIISVFICDLLQWDICEIVGCLFAIVFIGVLNLMYSLSNAMYNFCNEKLRKKWLGVKNRGSYNKVVTLRLRKDLRTPLLWTYHLAPFPNSEFVLMHVENFVVGFQIMLSTSTEYPHLKVIKNLFSFLYLGYLCSIVLRVLCVSLLKMFYDKYNFPNKVCKKVLSVVHTINTGNTAKVVSSINDFHNFYGEGVTRNHFMTNECWLTKQTEWDKLGNLLGGESPEDFRESIGRTNSIEITRRCCVPILAYKRLNLKKLVHCMCLKFLVHFSSVLSSIPYDYRRREILQNSREELENVTHVEDNVLHLKTVLPKVLGIALVNDDQLISVQFNTMNNSKVFVRTSTALTFNVNQDELENTIETIMALQDFMAHF